MRTSMPASTSDRRAEKRALASTTGTERIPMGRLMTKWSVCSGSMGAGVVTSLHRPSIPSRLDAAVVPQPQFRAAAAQQRRHHPLQPLHPGPIGMAVADEHMPALGGGLGHARLRMGSLAALWQGCNQTPPTPAGAMGCARRWSRAFCWQRRTEQVSRSSRSVPLTTCRSRCLRPARRSQAGAGGHRTAGGAVLCPGRRHNRGSLSLGPARGVTGGGTQRKEGQPMRRSARSSPSPCLHRPQPRPLLRLPMTAKRHRFRQTQLSRNHPGRALIGLGCFRPSAACCSA
jgi:hypothetical protein